ncbi:MAG TPA: hypothetical protein VF719_11705 [Abditibacteriaceae bacterium]
MITGYTFNIAECFLWLVISIVLLIKSTRVSPDLRKTLRMLSVSFFLFGISDYIEAHTGAWWTPLWLLFLKGGCIMVFVLGFRNYYRVAKRS